ncbi:MAG TPA: secretion protein HlyD, partial [Woeseiaceae bacterium]|nr:secretion protein HlyD [Woeseiaceae bacterium]
MSTPNILHGKIRWVAIVVVAIAIGSLLYFWLLRDSSDHDALRLYGNVDIRELELSFRQPGRVSVMVFDEGDSVRAGEVMARLDAGPYRDRMAAAEAELGAAKAELGKLQSGNRPQEIAQAQERVHQAQASVHEAERNFQRQSSLLESGT